MSERKDGLHCIYGTCKGMPCSPACSFTVTTVDPMKITCESLTTVTVPVVKTVWLLFRTDFESKIYYRRHKTFNYWTSEVQCAYQYHSAKEAQEDSSGPCKIIEALVVDGVVSVTHITASPRDQLLLTLADCVKAELEWRKGSDTINRLNDLTVCIEAFKNNIGL